MKGLTWKYELIILHPSHLLIGGVPVAIKHPSTHQFVDFFIPQGNSGFLCEGSPAGPHLPALSSQGDTNRLIPLNPILVNFAAMVRLR